MKLDPILLCSIVEVYIKRRWHGHDVSVVLRDLVGGFVAFRIVAKNHVSKKDGKHHIVCKLTLLRMRRSSACKTSTQRLDASSLFSKHPFTLNADSALLQQLEA